MMSIAMCAAPHMSAPPRIPTVMCLSVARAHTCNVTVQLTKSAEEHGLATPKLVRDEAHTKGTCACSRQTTFALQSKSAAHQGERRPLRCGVSGGVANGSRARGIRKQATIAPFSAGVGSSKYAANAGTAIVEAMTPES